MREEHVQALQVAVLDLTGVEVGHAVRHVRGPDALHARVEVALDVERAAERAARQVLQDEPEKARVRRDDAEDLDDAGPARTRGRSDRPLRGRQTPRGASGGGP